MSLENTYLNIKEKFENSLDLEPFYIIKAVDDHRNFWKPKNVRILLLAESHVHTLIDEYNKPINQNNFQDLDECPANYVRLVYCLGYGENSLVKVDNNRGTPHYWKIFVSCIHGNIRSEFDKILVSKTEDFEQRLYNKISLLEKLKEKEIWLLDASIVALYKNKEKPNPKIRDEIIKTCWKEYISQIINRNKPEKIIVIGNDVSNSLEVELKKTGIPIFSQKQPNSYMSKKEISESFEMYYNLCNSQNTTYS